DDPHVGRQIGSAVEIDPEALRIGGARRRGRLGEAFHLGRERVFPERGHHAFTLLCPPGVGSGGMLGPLKVITPATTPAPLPGLIEIVSPSRITAPVAEPRLIAVACAPIATLAFASSSSETGSQPGSPFGG